MARILKKLYILGPGRGAPLPTSHMGILQADVVYCKLFPASKQVQALAGRLHWCGAKAELTQHLPAKHCADKTADSSKTNSYVSDTGQKVAEGLWWGEPQPFVLCNCVIRIEEVHKLKWISLIGNWMPRIKNGCSIIHLYRCSLFQRSWYTQGKWGLKCVTHRFLKRHN